MNQDYEKKAKLRYELTFLLRLYVKKSSKNARFCSQVNVFKIGNLKIVIF